MAPGNRNDVKLQNIFFEAIENHYADVSEFLINNDMVSVNAISTRSGELALMFAASNKDLYTLEAVSKI